MTEEPIYSEFSDQPSIAANLMPDDAPVPYDLAPDSAPEPATSVEAATAWTEYGKL